MIENAVNYFWDLRNQGVSLEVAKTHTAQRFGVSPGDLMYRVAGGVADPKATREALADARGYLDGTIFWEYDDADELAHALRNLYVAITGEDLSQRRVEYGCDFCKPAVIGCVGTPSTATSPSDV